MLDALGFAGNTEGLSLVVIDELDGNGPGVLLAAFGTTGAGASGAALRTVRQALQGSATTFTSDPALDSQWRSLLQTIDPPSAYGAGGRGSGINAGRGRGGRGSYTGATMPRSIDSPNAAGRGGRGRGRGAPLGRGGARPAIGTPHERPYGVWLPGLQRVSKLLNGTAGVRRVASSKVHKIDPRIDRAASDPPPDDPDGESVVASGTDGGGPRPGGVKDRLIIRIDGTGNYGAHRLQCGYENSRGLRTQQLFVSCDPSFSLDQLRDVLRALQPVLNFLLE